MRNATLAAGALLGLAVSACPALGWEHILQDYGNDQILSASLTYDLSNSATLTLGCMMGTGILHMQVVTTSQGVPPAAIALSVVAGGNSFPLSATMGDAQGFLQVTTSSETAPTGDIARAIYGTSEIVEIAFAGRSYSFTGAGQGDAFGAMMDSCL